MISSQNLPNEQKFSNAVDWNKIAQDVKNVKDTLSTNPITNEVVPPKPEPVSETKILGMHPMTFMFVSLGVVALSITVIVLHKK